MKYITEQDIKENIVVIKINESYYEGISAEALYDYTRGIWYRSLKSVSDAKYALSVVDKIVVEVYKINRWMPATKAIFKTRTVDPKRAAKRVAFEGTIAENSVRNRYIGKSVAYLFEYGASNPCVSFRKHS
jgi:hypothetical protein